MLLIALVLAPDVPNEMNFLFTLVGAMRTLKLTLFATLKSYMGGEISFIAIDLSTSLARKMTRPIT